MVLAVLCVLSAAACWFDYHRKRIPNVLIVLMALTGIYGRCRAEGIRGAVEWAMQAALIGGILYPFFRIGAIGAGDVKLFGVSAGCLPSDKILLFLLLAMAIAALISLGKLLRHHQLQKSLRRLLDYVADVASEGRWKLYGKPGTDSTRIKICLSGPVFVSLLLFWGGIL